jgi:hypothetical protein
MNKIDWIFAGVMVMAVVAGVLLGIAMGGF